MIDDYHNIKRIIKIGWVDMEKGEVEVCLICPYTTVEEFTTVLCGMMVEFIDLNIFVKT